MNLLLTEDERLSELFCDPSTVEYDGYERGRDDFEMFFYGTDADTMATLIIPQLRNLPFAGRGVVFKRHGDRGARQETIKLV